MADLARTAQSRLPKLGCSAGLWIPGLAVLGLQPHPGYGSALAGILGAGRVGRDRPEGDRASLPCGLLSHPPASRRLGVPGRSCSWIARLTNAAVRLDAPGNESSACPNSA